MKNAKNLLLSLVLVFVSSCDVEHAPPDIETCVSNGDGSGSCADLRNPKEKQKYQKLDTTNMICTNTDDYKTLYNYTSQLREDLIKCERKKGKR